MKNVTKVALIATSIATIATPYAIYRAHDIFTTILATLLLAAVIFSVWCLESALIIQQEHVSILRNYSDRQARVILRLERSLDVATRGRSL